MDGQTFLTFPFDSCDGYTRHTIAFTCVPPPRFHLEPFGLGGLNFYQPPKFSLPRTVPHSGIPSRVFGLGPRPKLEDTPTKKKYVVLNTFTPDSPRSCPVNVQTAGLLSFTNRNQLLQNPI